MRAAVRFERVDEVEATLSITMKVKDWKALHNQLDGIAWPSWKLHNALTTLVARASKEVFDEHDLAPPTAGG